MKILPISSHELKNLPTYGMSDEKMPLNQKLSRLDEDLNYIMNMHKKQSVSMKGNSIGATNPIDNARKAMQESNKLHTEIKTINKLNATNSNETFVC